MALTSITSDAYMHLLPSPERSLVVIEAPGEGMGYWAGAPSALRGTDGAFYLAYRLRRPVGKGRGYANVVARSVDGIHFETVLTLHQEDFACDSLERPALIELADGRWRIYMSCATPDSFHWRVDVLEADDPSKFDPSSARTVLPGDEMTGMKDPVVLRMGDRWHLWACCHPLDVQDATDRMYSQYATSTDGIDWTFGDVVLTGRKGRWDARGARITSVLPLEDGRVAVYYDGRASADENWKERTGLAFGELGGQLTSATEAPVGSQAQGQDALRYVSVLLDAEGGLRLYYEATRRDGAHDLRTEYVPPSR